MHDRSGPHAASDRAIAKSVRANALWAAIPALILIYYGFMNPILWVAVEPSLASFGLWLTQVAIKAGGILLAVVALFCLSGRIHALLFDAVATFAVGAAFAVGGFLTISIGGSQFIWLIFGGILMTSGHRCWREYRTWVAVRGVEAAGAGTASFGQSNDAMEVREATANTADASTASKLIEARRTGRSGTFAEASSSSDAGGQRGVEDHHADSPNPSEAGDASDSESEGFLASFGREDSKDKPPSP